MSYNHPIPDAPIALSMLPRVEELDRDDLMYLVKPNNPIGQRSKAIEVGKLFDGDVAKFATRIICSNILELNSVSLPSYNTNTYLEVAHVDIDPRLDVDFHVWGISDHASDSSTQNRYDYGLTAKVRQFYEPDDTDRDLVTSMYAGTYDNHNDLAIGPQTPTYNANFGVSPFNYSPVPAVLALHPTKRVTLYLASGSNASPYQCNPPSEFTLKVQARIFPSKYDSTALVATE